MEDFFHFYVKSIQKGIGNMKREYQKAIKEVSAVIDILEATSKYYKEMKSVDVSDILVMVDIVSNALRDKVNVNNTDKMYI